MKNRFAKRFRRRTLASWAIACVTLLGLVSSLAQLFPSLARGLVSSIALLVASVASAAVYAWWSLRPDNLPSSDIWPESLRPGHSYSLEITDERSTLLSIHELIEDVYAGVESLPTERYEQWLILNSNILVCLFDMSRRVVGYFDVLPLRSDFLALMIEGRVGEHDIRREHILRPEEARLSTGLYIAGVAVSEWHSVNGKRSAAILVWGLAQYFAYLYPTPPDRSIYAHASSQEGARLLERFGFRRIAEAQGRREPFPLYAVELNEAYREMIRCSLPDFSAAVRLSWV